MKSSEEKGMFYEKEPGCSDDLTKPSARAIMAKAKKNRIEVSSGRGAIPHRR